MSTLQEYEAPGAVEIADDDNVVTAMLENARSFPDRPALAERHGDAFVDVSSAAFAATVRELASALVALGVEAGDRVCLFMPTRIEFTYLDYAIWAAGATTVTIYETSSPDQVEWIVGNSRAVAVVCGDAELRARLEQVAERLPECRHVLTLDGDRPGDGFEQLRASADPANELQVDERIAGIRHDHVATLVYTSGTTGRPKGCVITHGSLIWEVRQVIAKAGDLLTVGGSTLMFLPLAHILARVVQVACVTRGVKIAFSSGVAQLLPELAMTKPDFVFSVPRVFEKIFNTAQGKSGSGVQRKIFDRAVTVAERWSRGQTTGEVSLPTKLEHGLYDRLVYGKLREAFGGNLRFALSGGAPLGERLGHFFHGAGVLVLEGYGLTETTAAATVNTPDDFRIGTVGRPVPGAAARIADDGEILLHGGMVFSGYWDNPEATDATFVDGDWLASGDIGEIDADGFVRITGRKKDLIVTAAGKNVAPAVLEDVIRANALVSQVVVVGDQKPFVAAIVTLDPEELSRWANADVPQGSDPSEFVNQLIEDNEEALHAEIQQAIDVANAQVSRAESIREFRILAHDFTIEGGELTPTLKLKRNVVIERYSDTIRDIYGD